MMLETAAIIGGFGVALFVLGFAFERPELAMLGAIVIIGVGASGMGDGFEVKVGEVETTNDDTGETDVENVYEETGMHERFPIGSVVMIIGAVMLMTSSGAASDVDLRDEVQRKPPWER